MASHLSLPRMHYKYCSWFIWVVAAFSVPYQFLMQSSPSVMISPLMKQFHLSGTGIGVLTSTYFYAYLLLQIPAGMLIDRFGARVILFLSMFLMAVFCFIFAHAHTVGVAELSRTMMGVVGAPCVAGALYIAANWFALTRFALAVGLTESLGMIGAAIGEFILAAMVTGFGWRTTVVLCAVFGVILAAAAIVVIRNRPNQRQIKALQLERIVEARTKGVVREFMMTMRNPQIWLLGLFSGLTFSFIAAFAGLWGVPILQGLYGVNLEVAAMGSAMVFLGAAIGAPILAWLASFFGRRRLIMSVATLLNVIVIFSFIYWPHLLLWVVFGMLIVIGFLGGVYVLPFSMVREMTDANVRASGMGFTNMMCILIGAPLLQPLIGYLLKRHVGPGVSIAKLPANVYQHALAILLVSLVLALLVIFFIREEKSSRVETQLEYVK